MRKLYRGTSPFGADSMYYVKDGKLAFMFWPEGMPVEQIKHKLEEAEDMFMYVELDYLDKITDLRPITEW